MRETNRKSMYHEECGIACGPVSITAIDAEITVDDDGKLVYLHAQWVDEASAYLLLEATTESAYEIYEKLNNAEDEEFDNLIAERDRICSERIEDDSCYAHYYDELKDMISKEMKMHGIEADIDETTII